MVQVTVKMRKSTRDFYKIKKIKVKLVKPQRKFRLAMISVQKMSQTCRKIELRGIHDDKNVQSHFNELYEHADTLQKYFTTKHLRAEFNEVQKLKLVPTCTVIRKKIDRVTFFLKTDIDNFFKTYRETVFMLYKKFTTIKKSSDSQSFTQTEKSELVKAFCSMIHNIYETWGDLYFRIARLKLWKSKKQSSNIDPLRALYYIHMRSIINIPSKLSDQQLRVHLFQMRDRNKTVHNILREVNIELSDIDLERLRVIEKHLSSKDASEEILASARYFMKGFKRKMTALRLASNKFRMSAVDMCLEFEASIKQYSSPENNFVPNAKLDITIINHMSSFFGTVFHKYLVFFVELGVLRKTFQERWNYYVQSKEEL